MLFTHTEHFSHKTSSFNMTPMVDIVFNLIIFFMLACQSIVAENFEVAVPDHCRFAKDKDLPGSEITTVTVMRTRPGGKIGYAVGSEQFSGLPASKLTLKIARAIDKRVGKLPPKHRLVSLRVDKDICFADVQYALAAIAKSCAQDIHLAALKYEQPDKGQNTGTARKL